MSLRQSGDWFEHISSVFRNQRALANQQKSSNTLLVKTLGFFPKFRVQLDESSAWIFKTHRGRLSAENQRRLEGQVIESQNDLSWMGPLKFISFHLPCHVQRHLLLDQVAQSDDGTFATSLGNLLQYLATFTVKNLFFISKLNLTFFSLKLLLCFLLLQALAKRLSPYFLSASFE